MDLENYKVINLTKADVEKNRLFRQIAELNLGPSWKRPFNTSLTKHLRASVFPRNKIILIEQMRF
ncbi:MAG: hypothetical protein ACTSRW_08880 [Candidatus Helarchaeota archaeon]